MISFLGKTLLHGRRASVSSSNLPFSPTSLSLFRKCFSGIADNNSFVVSYLVNSCGLSPEKAVNAAKQVHFKTPEKPDSVIDFLKDRDFSETQISTIIRKRPDVLLCNPDKTLLPKFDFFYAKGISSRQLAKIISIRPHILRSSLAKQLIPSFNFFVNMLESKEKTFDAIKRHGEILCVDLKSQVIPNIHMLRENGIPESNIRRLLLYQPRKLLISLEQLTQTVEEVKGMGFNPLLLNFVQAINALRSMSRTTWEKKVDCYKKWGWSDEDIILAFGRNPLCMTLSEKKIGEGMNYLNSVMGLNLSFICRTPSLLLYSLKNRLVPRGSVAKVLLSKGLIKEGYLARFFSVREELFIEKFVKLYEKEAPELLNLYTEKLNLSKKLVSEANKSKIC